MPTENRSSNTEMVSVRQREDRYIVIKRSDLDKIPGKQRLEFSRASRIVHDRMFAAGAPARQFLVIESDWPEYELAWASIEARVLGSGAAPLTGSRLLELHSSELRAARMEIATLRAQLDEAPKPAPQPHPDPIAWMVGTAFWWTKEEAERDAKATGLPIVGFGPITDAAELERLRAALKFYADRDHFAEDIGTDWDSVSGEPANILWHEHEAWFVEDGSIARAALSGQSEQDQRLRIADPSTNSVQARTTG